MQADNGIFGPERRPGSGVVEKEKEGKTHQDILPRMEKEALRDP